MNYEWKIGYLDDYANFIFWSTYAKDKEEAVEKFKKQKGNRIIVKVLKGKEITLK